MWCVVCGARIGDHGRGPDRRTCSARCRNKAHRAKASLGEVVALALAIQQGHPRPEPPPEYWGQVEELVAQWQASHPRPAHPRPVDP